MILQDAILGRANVSYYLVSQSKHMLGKLAFYYELDKQFYILSNSLSIKQRVTDQYTIMDFK